MVPEMRGTCTSLLGPADIAADTDNDSLLLLRLMVFAHIIQLKFKGPGLPWCFREHPEDPTQRPKSPNAGRCSTIWRTQAVRSWCKSLGLATIHFDQCQLGQCVAKSTVLPTNLPLRHWAGLSCTHGLHEKPSGDPPLMMQGIAKAIKVHTRTIQPTIPCGGGPLRTLRIDLRQHQPRESRLSWTLQFWFDWVSRFAHSGMGEASPVVVGNHLL